MFSPPEEKMYQVKENMIMRMNKDEHHIGKKISLDDLYFKINDLKLDDENRLISEIKFADNNNNIIVLCLVNGDGEGVGKGDVRN